MSLSAVSLLLSMKIAGLVSIAALVFPFRLTPFTLFSSPCQDRPSSSWNLKGLQTEITKNLDRTTRKLAKKTQKDASSPSVQNLKDRLSALKTLEFNVGGLMRNDEGVDLEEAVGLALELGLSDEPPEPQKRGPKKQKGELCEGRCLMG